MTLDDRLGTLNDLPVASPQPPRVLRRRTQRRRIQRIGIAVTVACLTGGAVLLRSDDQDRRAVRTVDQPATPAPDGLDHDTVEYAKALVAEFMSHLRGGELDKAAALWSGGPLLDADDLPGKVEALQELLVAKPWLGEGLVPVGLVTPSAGFDVLPVVTVLSDGQDGVNHAAAILVGPIRGREALDALEIKILPRSDQYVTPSPGTVLTPGDRIVFDGTGIEGGMRAHINGTEVPTEADHATQSTSLTVPADVTGPFVVTVSFATPELPSVGAYWYRGGPDHGLILDLVGLTVREARTLVTERGFQFAVNQGDPDFETAIVLAVEPQVEERLPTGAVIGARTVLRDPPVSVECPNTRHPRFGGSGDGLPYASQITRQSVETELIRMRASGQFPRALYLGKWNRFANTIDGQASIERHDGYQIIAVVDHEADCPGTITFAGGPPITFVTVSPDGWPG